MQALWIEGERVTLTPRAELRLALRAGQTMNGAEAAARRALMSADAFRRFERLWAVSTATEHAYTQGWPLERWSARRAAACRAVRAFVAEA